MKKTPFVSGFAILDVKSGRAALAKRIAAGEKVRVRIDIVINTPHGQDDGISIEFRGNVASVKPFKAPAPSAKRKGRK
jgi:hypothetical protein